MTKIPGGSAESRTQPVTIAGVHGVLAKDASNNYTFTRDSTGSAVSVPAGSTLTVDTGDWWGSTLVFDIFRNGFAVGHSVSSMLANLTAMIAVLTPLAPHYIVCGCTTMRDGSEDTGSPNGAAIASLNAQLSTTYGARYLDVLALLQANGSGTGQDAIDVAAGRPPQSLMSADNLHPNAAGAAVIVAAIAAKTSSLHY